MTREERNLVLAAVDGSLPVDAETRLCELLKQDTQALEMYTHEALLHGELEWHFGTCRQSLTAQRRRAEVMREFRLRKTKRRAYASLGLAAAVLILLAVIAVLHRVPPPVVSLRFNDGAVSQLVRSGETQDQAGPVAGDQLIIERGAVELTFPQGVRAVIEAPAELEFVEGNALKMNHGTGYFHIDRPQAKGFALTLPHSKVVDLGTSFGVIAPVNGPAEVHLIEGRVEIHRHSGSSDPAAELKPGHAYREDDESATGFSSILFRKDRFARQLPERYEHVAIDFDQRNPNGSFVSSGPVSATVREVTVNRGHIRQVPGRFGKAVRFDRSGSHLEIRGWAEYHHRPSGTLTFWVRLPEATNRPRYCPVSWGSTERDDAGRWSVAIEAEPKSAGIAIRAGVASSSHLSSVSRLRYGTWHHLAFVFGPEADGHTKVRTFVDGSEDPNSTFLPILSSPSLDDGLVIGTHHDPELWASHAFTADIDDLRIYRSALDAEQISILARGADPSQDE